MFAGLFGFKMRANKRFFLLRLPNCFSMCLDSDKKILPLCYKRVIAMSSRKSKEKYHQLVFSEVCLEHVHVIGLITVFDAILTGRQSG